MNEWRAPFIVCLLAAALTFMALLARDLLTTDDRTTVVLDGEEEAFLALINQYREQNGLTALTFVPELRTAAEWMSADMGANAYFEHTDSLGRDTFERMAAFGYGFNTWKGENLAAGTSSAQETFYQWQTSPAHDANMLNPNFVAVGLGRIHTEGSPFGWYWTSDFGGFIPSVPAPVTPTAIATAIPVLPSTIPTPTPCSCR